MRDDPTAASVVRDALASIPPEERCPKFGEPWQAQAFAIAVALHERGVFTWPEWAATLGHEIELARSRGDPDLGDTYYLHWLAAIESLLQKKGVTDEATLARYRDAWDKAADRTPHGQPIVLTPEDLA